MNRENSIQRGNGNFGPMPPQDPFFGQQPVFQSYSVPLAYSAPNVPPPPYGFQGGYQVQYVYPILPPYSPMPQHGQQQQGPQNNLQAPPMMWIPQAPQTNWNVPSFIQPSISAPSFPPQYQPLAKFDDPFELKEIPPTAPIQATNVDNTRDLPKRCKRCIKYYSNSEPTECRYHPGTYKNVYQSRIVAGRINTWSCCNNDSRDARGCKIGIHVECEATSATLSQLDNMLAITKSVSDLPMKKKQDWEKKPKSEKTLKSEREEFIDTSIDLMEGLEKFKIAKDSPSHCPKLEEVTSIDLSSAIVYENGQQYIKHIVKLTDTVRGLSLKYNVAPEEVKISNKLTKDEDIWTRHVILIPYNGQELPEPTDQEKERYRNEMRQRLVRRFVRATNCSCDAEALYYLEMSLFNFDAAIAEFKEDSNWEKAHGHKKFSVKS